MISVYFIMGPEIEIKDRPESTMDASVNKDNSIVAKEAEPKHLKCVSNHEDYIFEMDTSFIDQASNGHMSEDREVDVMDITHSAGNELVDGKSEEATESSSSFDDVSGVENDAVLGDAEVVSDFHDDATSALGFDRTFTMRKKKLTPHWRAFIQPLIWRCKWVELQVKKLKFQAHKYDKELAEYNQKKQFQVENLTAEGFSIKSVPFSSDSRRDKVLKRKKRRRTEDTMDVTTYMLQHNLFSYYENRKVTADGAFLDNEWSNGAISAEKINYNDESGLDNELVWLESRDGDESIEQILRRIGALQGQVIELRTRLDKVISDNAGKFSYSDKMSLLVPCNALMSSARDSASPPYNGDRMAVGSSRIASQLMSQYNEGDVILPEGAVSSHGEVIHLPDVIESTNQSQLGGGCHAEDDILIDNDRVKEEMNSFVEVKIQPVEKPQAAKEWQGNTITPALVEPDLPTDDRPSPKTRSISKLTASKNKKRKGRRKSGSGKRRRS